MFPYRVKYTESESDIQKKKEIIIQNTPKTPKYIRTCGTIGISKTNKECISFYIYIYIYMFFFIFI